MRDDNGEMQQAFTEELAWRAEEDRLEELNRRLLDEFDLIGRKIQYESKLIRSMGMTEGFNKIFTKLPNSTKS